MAERDDEKPLRRKDLVNYQNRIKNGEDLTEVEIDRVRKRQKLEDHRQWLWSNFIWFLSSLSRVVFFAGAVIGILSALGYL